MGVAKENASSGSPHHNIQHFCVRELGTRSETYRGSALTGVCAAQTLVWMNDLLLLRCSVSARSCCENGRFAACARTLRQLSLRIDSVYRSVSNLLSCLLGFVIDLHKAICGCTLGANYCAVRCSGPKGSRVNYVENPCKNNCKPLAQDYGSIN